MADTETKQQTQQAPQMEMREDGMPDGQAPAVHQPQQQRREAPESPNQKRARVKIETMGRMVDALDARRADLEKVLSAQRIPFDNFKAAVILGLKNTMKNDSEFFEVVRPALFFEEVQRACHLGLMPDGKQCAIARFKAQPQLMVMVEGYVKILFDTGIVKDINHNLVLTSDAFDFEEGSDPWVRHKPDLDGDPNAEDPKGDNIRAAWCFVTTKDEGRFLEVVRKADLIRISRVSQSTKGPRKNWPGEMHRKAPFRRIVKRLPHHPRLELLVAEDDRAVDLERRAEPETDAERRREASRGLTSDQLFSRTRAELPDPADYEGALEPIDGQVDETEDEEEPDREDYSQVESGEDEDQGLASGAISAARAAEDSATLAQSLLAWQDSPGFARASDETRSWVAEAFSKRADQLAGMAPDDEPDVRLLAITSSTQKEAKAYEDPALWKADVLTKLNSLTADQVAAFWKRNAGFIRAADARGVEEAASLMQTFAAKGVSIGRDD